MLSLQAQCMIVLVAHPVDETQLTEREKRMLPSEAIIDRWSLFVNACEVGDVPMAKALSRQMKPKRDTTGELLNAVIAHMTSFARSVDADHTVMHDSLVITERKWVLLKVQHYEILNLLEELREKEIFASTKRDFWSKVFVHYFKRDRQVDYSKIGEDKRVLDTRRFDIY